MLLELQQSFRAAVLGDDDSALAASVAGDPAAAEGRIAIYRNNVRASLTEALARSFPVTRRIIGEVFFSGMARAFIAVAPPRMPQLSAYGAGFPAFIARFGGERPQSYLADVARLEWACIESLFAADAPALDLDAVAAQGEAIASATFVLHPATRWLRSAFPVVTIWESHQSESEYLPPLDLTLPENALVTRTGMNVRVRRIGSANAALVESLGRGLSLGKAADLASTEDPEFDLGEALAAHFTAGSFGARQANDQVAARMSKPVRASSA
jgi:hypothetical protein